MRIRLRPSLLFIAIVVILTVSICLTIDERRLSSVKIGMSFSEVQTKLGPATDVFHTPLPPVYAPRNCHEPASVTAAALYLRTLRDSLFVFLDKESRVVCTERVSISYDVRLLTGKP
jgi:hypothetical protein